ncbi:MAG: 16S rRNA (uracil(1498)-N(3))-methyltransferase [Bacilli bacterium]|nr:16S rRNA (uracil(1498)-N(3))-methyltransferase [Bacilli bacterium]
MQRYFASVNKDNIILSKDDAFHLLKVMRAKIDDEIIAIDKEELYLGKVISLNPLIISNLGIYQEENRELKVKTTLFFALAKGDKIDFVIQKATELGVSRIVLIKTERSIVKISQDDFIRKLPRYLSISKEASEQCRRRTIPEIIYLDNIKNIPSSMLADINYVAYEEDAFSKVNFFASKEAKSVSLLIGPEGGLSIEEVNTLVAQGFKRISLGKRILRTETAALVGLAMINMVVEQ